MIMLVNATPTYKNPLWVIMLVRRLLNGNLETYSKHSIWFMKVELAELAKKLEHIVSSGTT